MLIIQKNKIRQECYCFNIMKVIMVRVCLIPVLRWKKEGKTDDHEVINREGHDINTKKDNNVGQRRLSCCYLWLGLYGIKVGGRLSSLSSWKSNFVLCVGHNRTSEIETPVGLLFTLIVNPLHSFICIFRIRFCHSVFILGGSRAANYRQITSNNNNSMAHFIRGENWKNLWIDSAICKDEKWTQNIISTFKANKIIFILIMTCRWPACSSLCTENIYFETNSKLRVDSEVNLMFTTTLLMFTQAL